MTGMELFRQGVSKQGVSGLEGISVWISTPRSGVIAAVDTQLEVLKPRIDPNFLWVRKTWGPLRLR